MKYSSNNPIAGVVGLVVVIFLVIFVLFSANRLGREIRETGLKNIISDIWEGDS